MIILFSIIMPNVKQIEMTVYHVFRFRPSWVLAVFIETAYSKAKIRKQKCKRQEFLIGNKK